MFEMNKILNHFSIMFTFVLGRQLPMWHIRPGESSCKFSRNVVGQLSAAITYDGKNHSEFKAITVEF